MEEVRVYIYKKKEEAGNRAANGGEDKGEREWSTGIAPLGATTPVFLQTFKSEPSTTLGKTELHQTSTHSHSHTHYQTSSARNSCHLPAGVCVDVL